MYCKFNITGIYFKITFSVESKCIKDTEESVTFPSKLINPLCSIPDTSNFVTNGYTRESLLQLVKTVLLVIKNFKSIMDSKQLTK